MNKHVLRTVLAALLVGVGWAAYSGRVRLPDWLAAYAPSNDAPPFQEKDLEDLFERSTDHLTQEDGALEARRRGEERAQQMAARAKYRQIYSEAYKKALRGE
jgi:hypothetical protein